MSRAAAPGAAVRGVAFGAAVKRQRGVALLAALLAVALAVVLVAALLDRGEEVRMRTAHALRAEQSWQLLRGLEGWAIKLLRDEESDIDSRADLWARPLAPIEVPGGRVGGALRELGGCFNLNSLGNYQGTDYSAAMLRRFQRLLAALRLDPGIAAAALDWVDPDVDPTTGGAEDMQYRVAAPPYRAANRPFVHVSELRLVRGVDADTYARLLPHVCVLPDEDTPMNLNTASVELWMSLRDDITEGMARRLWLNGEARYDNAQLQAALLRELRLPPESPLQDAGLLAGVNTRYFVMRAEIQADGLPFLYSSLIDRAPTGGARVLARVRGSW